MNDDIEGRIQKTLKEMGLQGFKVTCDGQGCVELIGTVTDYNECALAVTVARTTVGVRSVTNQPRVPQ